MGGGEHRSLNQQPSGFTPILGLRKSEILKKKIKAFTLAEVLITLAIIGVVAALTIPTVVAKYQKKQYYTQFMKMYNTLSTALSMAQVENGVPDTWGLDGYGQNEILEKNILPYLKISKKITTNDKEYDYPYSFLNGKSFQIYEGNTEYFTMTWSESAADLHFVYVLSDGSIIRIYNGNGVLFVEFDTTGLKGPNVLGRDIFSLQYIKLDDKWTLSDAALYDEGKSILAKEVALQNALQDCGPNETDMGSSCGARLLLEGKMDY